MVSSHTNERLETVATRIEKHVRDTQEGNALRGAVAWIRSVSSQPEVPKFKPANSVPGISCKMKILSENLAIVDMLEESLALFSDEDKGYFVWPVWVGQIKIDCYSPATELLSCTVASAIYAPMQRPSFMPGSSLLQNRNPYGVFRCEPYNLIPLPPWGAIVPLLPGDGLSTSGQSFCEVAAHLNETDEVAVPSGFQHLDCVDVRIVTKTQAKELSSRLTGTIKTSWLMEPDGNPACDLICCWFDDSLEWPGERAYVEYIVSLMRVRSRIIREDYSCRK